METVRDVPCPTCGRMFHKFSVGKHKPNCPDKAENRALIAQWLPSPELPGYARTETEYLRNTPNKPCSNSLKIHFGKWSLVAESFGLQAVDSNFYRIQKKMQATGAELRRLSDELHDGRYGPTRKEYCWHNQGGGAGTCAMDASVLGDKFGNWAAVLANWDLVLPPVEAVKEPVKLEACGSSPYWFSGWYEVTYSPNKFALVEG